MTTSTIKIGSPATAWASLTATSLANATAIGLNMDYRGATTFEWTAHAAEHLNTDSYVHKRIQFEVDGTVRFRGRVESVEGLSDENAYRFTCTDFRGCARNVDIQRDPASAPSYPERIYNAPHDDVDFNKNIAVDQEVGQILKDLFDTHDDLLLAEDGLYDISGATFYIQAELDALDYVPDKVVLSGLNFEAAVTSVLAEMGRAYAVFVDPDTGIWHFYNIRDDGTGANIILGAADSDAVADNVRESLAGCYTALSLYGSLGAGEQIKKAKIGVGYDGVGTTLSGLEKKWDTNLEPGQTPGDWTITKSLGERDFGTVTAKNIVEGTSYIVCAGKTWKTDIWIGGSISFPKLGKTIYPITDSTANTIYFTTITTPDVLVGDPFALHLETDYTWVFRRFKITDSAARDVIEGGEYSGIDCCPRLFVYGFIENDPTKDCVARQVVPIRFVDKDEADGPYILAKFPLYTSNIAGAAGTMSGNFALEYCYRGLSGGAELKARYPAASYTGDAYTVHGIEREKSLVISEFDSPDEEDGFVSLAQELLKPYMDPSISGSVTLKIVDWDYLKLDKLISLYQDGVSAPKYVGITLVGAQYRFLDNLTRLDLSNDFRDDFGYDKLLDRFVLDIKTKKNIMEGTQQDQYIQCSKGGILTEAEHHEEPEIDHTYTGLLNASSWGNFNQADQLTRCDSVTYTPAGVFNENIPCPYGGTLLACKYNRAGQAYTNPITGSNYPNVHGITLRSGSGAGGSAYANTHLLYPYYCKDAQPSSSYGRCGGTGMKDLELIIPSDVSSDNMSLAAFLPIMLRAWANFVTFTSQGMSCLDDRLYILDQNLWGNPIKANQKCGNQYDNINLVEMICKSMQKCYKYLSDYISNVDLHYSMSAAKVGAACGGGHASPPPCAITTSAGPATIPDYTPGPIDYKCCPVCSIGNITLDCCKTVRDD